MKPGCWQRGMFMVQRAQRRRQYLAHAVFGELLSDAELNAGGVRLVRRAAPVPCGADGEGNSGWGRGGSGVRPERRPNEGEWRAHAATFPPSIRSLVDSTMQAGGEYNRLSPRRNIRPGEGK